MDLIRHDGIMITRSGRLAPLLIGALGRQATSRTAQVQASLSRPSLPPLGSATPVPGSFLQPAHGSAPHMPMQPPRFGRPTADRKPWQRPVGQPDRRKRGRAGQRDRAQVLREEPFCRACLKRDLEVAADEVDHIKPLSEGGSDARSNKQALCTPCHAAKTATDRSAARGPRPDAD